MARPSTAGSVSVTGPAVWPPSGGSPASTAASASWSPSSSRLVCGTGSVPVSAPTAIASGAEAGRADRAAAGRRRALVAGGRDHERAEAGGADDRVGLGRVREARVGRVDAYERDGDVVGGVVVAVRVDGVLEARRSAGRWSRRPRRRRRRLSARRSGSAAPAPPRRRSRPPAPFRSSLCGRRSRAGLGVAVAVDGVVAGVSEAVERVAVDAGVEHGDRRRGVQAGLARSAPCPGSAPARSWPG